MKINKIEKNVPFPKNSRIKYPWREMKVGDSVLIQPDEGERLFKLRGNVGTSAHFYEQTSGKRFRVML